MSNWQATSRSIARRLVVERTRVLAGATAFLVVVGLIALVADAYDWVLVCVLLLQAAIVGYLLTAPEPKAAADTATRAAVDRASARTLADLAHARQSILDAIAQTSAGSSTGPKAP